MSHRSPPLSDRPRERLASHGATALTAVELLAILLGTGRAGVRVEVVAEDLHRAAGGSLRRLARQPLGELRRLGGIGAAKAARLAAALELGRRLCSEVRPVRARVRNPEDIVAYMGGPLRDLEVEELHLVVLSAQHDVIRTMLVTRGLLTGSLVHPREVFRPAIVEAGAGIVVVHNHPSGDPTPSPEDQVITSQLVAAGAVLGIPLLDHIIVGGDRWVSMSREGML